MPITVNHSVRGGAPGGVPGGGGAGNSMRLPTGSAPSQYFVIALLITATRCDSSLSRSENTRPFITGMPMAVKYCGVATRTSAVGRRSGSSTTRPSMLKRVVPGAPPPSGTALVIAAAFTPGCACRRSSTGK